MNQRSATMRRIKMLSAQDGMHVISETISTALLSS